MGTEKYLFDTDTITNILKPKPSTKLLKMLNGLSRPQQYISTITISEIVYGAMKSNRPEYHLENLQNVLLPMAHIACFDSKAAFFYGELRAAQEKKGKSLNTADLQIASIAMANDLFLVTGNTRHFEMIDNLRIINWI